MCIFSQSASDTDNNYEEPSGTEYDIFLQLEKNGIQIIPKSTIR